MSEYFITKILDKSFVVLILVIHTRCRHKSVTMRNKLFVIGGGTDTCEVYDSACKQFLDIKQPVFNLSKSWGSNLRNPAEAAFAVVSDI